MPTFDGSKELEDQDEGREGLALLDPLVDPLAEQLHPAIFPWLLRELKVERLSFLTQQYIWQDLMERYDPDDLMRPPSQWAGINWENFRNDVRRQIQREREHARRLEKAALGTGRTVQERDVIRRALHLAVNVAEVNGGDGVEQSGVASTGVGSFQAGTERAEGKIFGRAMASYPAELVKLLSPQEEACAGAIGESLTVLLENTPQVRRFRNVVLEGILRDLLQAGKEVGRLTEDWLSDPLLLTEEEAEEWIRSPTFRFLSSSDLSHIVAEGTEAVPSLVPPEKSIRPSLVPLLRDLAQVTDWTPWYVEAWQAQQLRQQERQAAGEESTHARTVFYTPPGTVSLPKTGNYRSFRVTLRMNVGTDLAPDRGAVVHASAASSGSDTDEGKEFVRELIAPSEEGLLWVPFLPRDFQNIEDDRGDVTFPHMFPGSAAHELAELADRLAAVFPFEAWEIARFVLTGITPSYWPVQVTTYDTCGSGAPAARYEEVFLARLRSREPVRGYVQITAEPWISAETVQRYYRHYQREAVSKSREEVKGSSQNVGPIRTPAARFANALAWATSQYRMQKYELRVVVGSQHTTNFRRISLQNIYNAAREQTEGSAASDYSSFVKGLKRAAVALDLPHDLFRFCTAIQVWAERGDNGRTPL